MKKGIFYFINTLLCACLFFACENEESIITDPRQIQVDYKESVNKFITTFKNNCRRNRIDYFHLNTSDSIDKSLMNYLIKRGKLI